MDELESSLHKGDSRPRKRERKRRRRKTRRYVPRNSFRWQHVLYALLLAATTTLFIFFLTGQSPSGS